MLDFCYLVNPYYPPQRLMDELKANMEILLTQYPSGMRVVSLLAAKNYGVDQESIVVGNGAAELIKSIIEESVGKIGFIRPSFEEYYNRYDKDISVVFRPNTDDFSYSTDDLIEFFGDKNISSLVLVNPDNPSGNYIPKDDVLKIAQWCEDCHIQLIYDESFIDFAEEKHASIISDGNFEKFPNLLVIKSISKSYGVPGLRLRICVSANHEKIANLKNSVSIWNINSFAEFYLQIAEKYDKSYAEGLDRIKEARKKYVEGLKCIEQIRVFPSEANYIMIEILKPYRASELCNRMLKEYSILVKDLSNKFDYTGRQFIRIAVKTEDENAKLVSALRDCFSKI